MSNPILKSIQFLAYDKSLAADPQAMRLAWSQAMNTHGINAKPWSEWTSIDRDESIFLALKASGVDAPTRKTLYSLLDKRLWIAQEAPSKEVTPAIPLTVATPAPVAPVVQAVVVAPPKAAAPVPEAPVRHQAPPVIHPAPSVSVASPKAAPSPPIAMARQDVPLKAAQAPEAPALRPAPVAPPPKAAQAPVAPVLQAAVAAPKVPAPVASSPTQPAPQRQHVRGATGKEQSECDFVLDRSIVIGSITMRNAGFEPIGFRLLFDEISTCFSIVESRGEALRLFECPRAKSYMEAALSVEVRDISGHTSHIGLGRIVDDEITFKFEEPEGGLMEFSCFINRQAPYFQYLQPIEPRAEAPRMTPPATLRVVAQEPSNARGPQKSHASVGRFRQGQGRSENQRSQVATTQRKVTKSQDHYPDDELTSDDLARLRGELPMEVEVAYPRYR